MLIINANIITMENRNYKNGYILIKEGKIAQIGDMDELSAADDNLLDAAGKTIFPGFLDIHCHIGMWGDGLGFESADGNEETDPVTPQLRAIDAVNALDVCFDDAKKNGITTVLTGPGSANVIAGQLIAMKTDGCRVDKMAIASPVGMKFALGENPKTIYNSKEETPITRMGTAALIREQLFKAQRYLDSKLSAQDDDDASEPEYDMKCEALIPVLKREIKAYFHAHRADDIFTAIRIAKEFNLDYVLIHCTEGHKIANELAEENAKIITGPLITDRGKPELKCLTTKNPALLCDAGLDVAICTDHPEIPIQYLPLSCAIAHKEGLPREKALAAMTITAARIAGIDNHVGSIAVGKDADLVITDGDPLELSTKIFQVIINGKEIF